MKLTGICPKCGSKDVYPALHSNSNHIRPLETGPSAAVYTTHYVCRSCGYVEEWVKPSDLPYLQQNFGNAP